jgi:DNA polymerase III sliding clamp (beta) subunit (PCNA family)
VVNYLLGDESLVKTRSKSISLDEMDLEKLKPTKLKWQLFNVIVPIASIISFGLIVVYWRKRKYKSH